MGNDQFDLDEPQDNYGEETFEEPPQEPLPEEEQQQDRKAGTPVGTWVAVFGSSTVFHVLLLILLGMIIISQPEEDREEVTLQMPEEEEEKQKEITRRKVEKEVEKETEVTDPTVQTTEEVSEVQSETQAETGQSMDFSSNTPNNSPAERAIALGGGGGGGTYGSRGGAGLSGGGGGATTPERKAVKAALIWLARHQNDKGFWNTGQYDEQCPQGNKCKVFVDKTRNKVGTTGLALLAFLGAGYTHETNKKLDGIDVGNVVRKTLRWLRNRQKSNGRFHKNLYNHSIAAMGYAEAYGMTKDPKLKPIAQDGIDFLEHAQNTAGGKRLAWRYSANSGENDTSVTGWASMALKSAELAGLDSSKKAMQGALRWVEKVTNEKGLAGYKNKITSRSQAKKRRSMTPVGMLVRMFAHEKLNREQLKMLKGGSDFLVNRTPQWDPGATFKKGYKQNQMDYYYWYYGSLALYMFAGPGTELEDTGYWQKWNQPMKKAVLTGQQKAREGHEVGSWDPLSRWSGKTGRVYTTALNALTLEVYYRYDNALFQ
jgi:Na+-transporting methylmalonyl-CoA/oxaloacetate decarboxylase gamma subunit